MYNKFKITILSKYKWITELYKECQRFSSTSGHKKLETLRVVMDLDECMVCTDVSPDTRSFKPLGGIHTKNYSMKLGNAKTQIVQMNIRPGLHSFLSAVSKFATLYVMTAGILVYARPALETIDPKSIYFKKAFYREDFNYTLGKDLKILGNDFNERRTVLVDNMAYNFQVQPHNGILIKDFTNNPYDTELESVFQLLVRLNNEQDVRESLKLIYGDRFRISK